MNRSDSGQYILFSIAAGLFWGTSFPVVKLGFRYISPIWFAEMRLMLAFVSLLPLIRKKRVILKIPKPVWLLGFLNAAAFLLQFQGMTLTTASKAAFYVNSNLVFVAILSWLFFKEVFNWQKISSVLLALTGIYFLSFGGKSISYLFSGALKGDFLVLFAGLCWAGFMILNKKVLQRDDLSVLETVSLFLFTSALFMLPVAILFEPFPWPIANNGWFLLLFSSVISMAIPFYLWARGLKGLTPTVSSLLILVEIIVALLLSYFLLGEILDRIEFLGAVLLLSGMVLASLAAVNGDSAHPA